MSLLLVDKCQFDLSMHAYDLDKCTCTIGGDATRGNMVSERGEIDF